jgi:glycosyltransferase involved in cell wall biosynthesis
MRSSTRTILRKAPEISIVSPVYRCGECVAELHRQLVAVLEPLVDSFEIILVNDGCPANSWAALQAVAATDQRVKVINLSRNFGQHYAIAAGLHYSSGQWVVVMDCDLQDQPSEIPNLYRKAQEGFDIVYALRRDRQDHWNKRLLSHAFSMVYNLLSDIKIVAGACNFSIASRQVIDGYCQLKELSRSYHLVLRWLGFRSVFLEVDHGGRFAGSSAYTLRRGFFLAIESITSQSNKPLILSIRTGFFMSASAVAVGLYYIARYFMHGIGVEGWASVVVSLYFLGGLLLANMGVIGLYIGKVYNEVRERPLYIIRDLLNFDQQDSSMRALLNFTDSRQEGYQVVAVPDGTEVGRPAHPDHPVDTRKPVG